MATLEARKHPKENKIVIIQTPGRIMVIDDYEQARGLVDQLLEILAEHDPGHRVEVTQ